MQIVFFLAILSLISNMNGAIFKPVPFIYDLNKYPSPGICKDAIAWPEAGYVHKGSVIPTAILFRAQGSTPDPNIKLYYTLPPGLRDGKANIEAERIYNNVSDTNYWKLSLNFKQGYVDSNKVHGAYVFYKVNETSQMMIDRCIIYKIGYATKVHDECHENNECDLGVACNQTSSQCYPPGNIVLGSACEDDLNCKTPNSVCHEENDDRSNKTKRTCKCRDNFKKMKAIYNLPVMCVERVSIGSKCKTTEQCQLEVEQSICSHNYTCECPHGSAIDKHRACSSLKCNKDKKDTCSDNFSNRICKSNKCECDEGYQEDPNKFVCSGADKLMIKCYIFVFMIPFLVIIKWW